MAVKSPDEFLLWEDDDKAASLHDRLEQGAYAYRDRFGVYPNFCLISIRDAGRLGVPAVLLPVQDADESDIHTIVICVEGRPNVPPDWYWLTHIPEERSL